MGSVISVFFVGERDVIIPFGPHAFIGALKSSRQVVLEASYSELVHVDFGDFIQIRLRRSILYGLQQSLLGGRFEPDELVGLRIRSRIHYVLLEHVKKGEKETVEVVVAILKEAIQKWEEQVIRQVMNAKPREPLLDECLWQKP